jgi:serine/threonine protein kinase
MMSTYDNQTGRLPPQSLLQQHYVIVGQAGKGGMGAVYQAIDTYDPNRRRVAIKEMSQGRLSGEELREATEQFRREFTMLSRLSHPNLPRIYDAFAERGRSYLVMDFIDGKTLFQLLKESGNRPLPVLQVLDYASQLCDVLAYLHQQQPAIIFRDLKPTNVMVTPNGHVYLIDFGIARFFKEGQEQDTVLLGSPGYAPPEQHGSSQTNPRSDLYSLGATLHCCLTGRDPYHAEDRFVFPPVRQYNPQVPLEFDQLIQRLLALDEQQRPASAIEVQQVLTKIRQKATMPPTPLPQMSPSPALAATQYSRPAPPSNQGPPTGATVPSVPPIYGGRPLATPPAAPSEPIIARIWTPSFMRLFGLMLVLTLGVGTTAFVAITGSDHTVEFGLSLVLFLVAVIAGTMVRGALPKGLLFLTGLAALVAGLAFALQALGLLNFVNLNQLFTVGLAVAAIISLFWFTRPFTLVDRIGLFTAFAIAVACVFFQFFLRDEMVLAETVSRFALQAALGEAILKHILLLIAMITLILGTLVAAQMERVRVATSRN